MWNRTWIQVRKGNSNPELAYFGLIRYWNPIGELGYWPTNLSLFRVQVSRGRLGRALLQSSDTDITISISWLISLRISFLLKSQFRSSSGKYHLYLADKLSHAWIELPRSFLTWQLEPPLRDSRLKKRKTASKGNWSEATSPRPRMQVP